MAITYGFYNSLNKDRVYNAEQMSSIFNYYRWRVFYHWRCAYADCWDRHAGDCENW